MEKVKCKLCKNRYAKQQEWKSDQEKQFCLKCWSFIRYVRSIAGEFTSYLNHELGVKDINVVFDIDKRKPEQVLLDAIYGRSDRLDLKPKD